MPDFPSSAPGSLRPVVVGASRQSAADTPVHLALKGLGNTGNMAFSHAVERCLVPAGTPSLPLTSSSRPADVGDVVLMPCANFLTGRDHGGLQLRTQMLSDYGLPALALGLGAQADDTDTVLTLSADSQRFVALLAERQPASAPNIAVRGEYTRRVIEAAGFGEHVTVLGCPSLYINPDPQLGRQIAQRFEAGTERMSVGGWAAGIPADLESGLAQLARSTHGTYVVQHPTALSLLAGGQGTWDDPLVQRALKQWMPAKLLETQKERAWCRRHLRIYYNVPDWLQAAREHGGYLGCRIHGTMMSIQAGVPAVCIAHDSRTLELCETMGLPHISPAEVQAQGITVDNFRRWFAERFDPLAFDQRRLSLARQTLAFLQANRVQLEGSPLAQLASTTA